MVAALGWQSPWFPLSVAVLVLVGVARVALAAHTRVGMASRLLERTVAGALRVADRSDTSEEAIIGIADGLHTTMAFIDGAVTFAASTVSSAIAVLVLVHFIARDTLLLGLGGFVIAAGLTAVVRLPLEQRSRDAFRAYIAAIDKLSDALQGGLEIVAEAAEDRFLVNAAGVIDRWRRANQRFTAMAGIAARAPLLMGALIAGAIVWNRQGLTPSLVRDGVLVLACSPSLVSFFLEGTNLFRNKSRVERIVPFLQDGTTTSGTRKPNIEQVHWRSVDFGYGSKAVLTRVDIAVSPGDLVAFVGNNGSGKSTLLRLLLGVSRPSRGNIIVGEDTLDVVDMHAWRERIRYLSQRPYLPPRRTLRDALQFPSFDREDLALQRCMARVGLVMPLTRSVESLSAGERQRLALARLLGRDGIVYVLDEPDNNLDSSGIQLVRELMESWAAQKKIVLFAAHSQELIDCAHRVIRISEGQVTEEPRGKPPRALALGS